MRIGLDGLVCRSCKSCLRRFEGCHVISSTRVCSLSVRLLCVRLPHELIRLFKECGSIGVSVGTRVCSV